MQEQDDAVLTPKQVEEIYHIKRNHLSQLRYSGQGPVYMKPAPRTILYLKSDVDKWLAASRRITTDKTKKASAVTEAA
ncbi:helix-turn-helix domain-containing protein [Bifidobacterium sp. ESL0775]|uniref:helix-turn-helix transcriptional regulator n=1 Tax=Bifidobacterium sp. ESL0775 TaxID=2983230 RepID=UPI0023F97348|nr:helix-turn-helix domain-containing protein [Bifidobacterium sp. ESL0775]WEV68746.1 helix-turn-helix domain-containing protein [Bifidobacterium sp. ESL0775]